jgi:thiol-disulfide isomerase/thioredoxin
VLSPVVAGGALAAAGAVVGAVWLLRGRTPRAMAAAGVAVGLVGAVAAAAFLGIYTLMFALDWGGGTSDAALDAWRGRPAPAITVPLLDGGSAAIAAEATGRRALVVFWATWCGPCKREIPHLNRLHDELGDRVLLVAISDESPDVLLAARAEHGIRYPLASGDDLPPPFSDVRAVPTLFVLDAAGTIEDVTVGYSGYDELRAAALGPVAGS